jgi:hypothetical protein
MTTVRMPLEAVTDGKQHTLYFVSKPRNAAETALTGIASLTFGK